MYMGDYIFSNNNDSFNFTVFAIYHFFSPENKTILNTIFSFQKRFNFYTIFFRREIKTIAAGWYVLRNRIITLWRLACQYIYYRSA